MHIGTILKRLFSADALIRALPTLLIVIGLAILTASFKFFPEATHPISHGVSLTLAQTILIGGVVGVLLDTFKYIGIFTEAIHQVMFSDEHLRHRNDLSDIWLKVTSAISKGNFPALSPYLKSDVLGKYVPSDKEYYYSRYYRECVVEWYDKEEGIVTVDEYVEIDMETSPNVAEIDYTYWNETNSKLSGIPGFFEVKALKINDDDYHQTITSEPYTDEYGALGVRHRYNIVLQGNRSYKVQRSISKRICIDVEPFLEYSSHNFILNTTVKYRSKSKDLIPIFVSVGTDNFADKAVPGTEWPVHREFHSLMLPNQGYLIVVQRQN